MKKKILIPIIILVIAAGVFAGLYFGTDIFKKDDESNQSETSKLAKKLDEYLQNSVISESDALESFNKKLETSSFTNSGTVTVKTTGSNATSLKLSFDGKVDPSNMNVEQKVSTSYNGVNLSANVVKSNDLIGLQSSLITGSDYVAVRNSNLKDLATTLGLDSDVVSQIPNEITLDSIEALIEEYVPTDVLSSEDKLVEILDRYLSVIEKEVSGLDSTTSGSTKTIEITEGDIYSIAKSILETAKSDNDLLNLIVDYAEEYSTLTGEDTSVTTSDLKEAIEDAIDELNDESSSAEDGNKIVLELKYNSNNIIEEATMTVYSSNEEILTASFTSTDEELSVEMTADSASFGIEVTKEVSSDDVEYQVTYYLKESGSMVAYLKASLGYENLSSSTVTQNISVNVSYVEDSKTQSVSVSLTNDITFEDVDITELSDDNAVIINDLSESELTELAQSIYTRMGSY
jgi:hypothetical protein